nr:hypothetical protein [Megasphaera sp. NM10]
MEIGNPQGTGLAVAIGLFDSRIPGQIIACRLMDEQQIDIVDAQPFQGLIDSSCLFIQRRPQLRRNENIFPFDQTFFQSPAQSPADSFFVDVGIGRVDEAVTHLQGSINGFLRIFRADHEGPQA